MPKCWYSTSPDEPSSMQNIWQQHLGEQRLAELSLADKNMLARASVGYMLRIYKFTDMTNLLRDTPLTIPEIRKIRQALSFDFRAVLGLKMIIIRCMAREMQNQPRRLQREIRLVNQQMGGDNIKGGLILPSDAALYHNLDNMQLRRLLMLHLPELPVEKIPNVKQIIAECGALLQELSVFIDRFAARKHRFIMNSQNMHHHDITGELYFKATSAFYLYTPFQTPEHRKNSVKRAIHNQGMAIIDHYKRPENSRLRFDGADWYNLIQTDAYPVGKWTATAYNRPDNLSSVNHDIGLSSFNRVDNLMIIRDYVAKQGPTAEKILELLAIGEDNDEFIRFVQERINDQTLISNETIYNQLGRRRYLNLIADYLKLSSASVKGVVNEVRELLIR